MNEEIKNKIVLILGGTGAIGSAIAAALRREGAVVFQHGIEGQYAADVRKDGVRKLIEKVLAEAGRVDILINALSAPAKIGPVENKNWEAFQEQFNVQLKAAVEAALILVPLMKQKKDGKIINILTSYVEGEPPASLADYVTAKYAMLGFTKALAKELSRWSIAVNAVSPDIIKNKFSRSVPEKYFEIAAAQTSTGRLTVEEDVAKAVLLAVSKKAAEASGRNFVISGGKIIHVSN